MENKEIEEEVESFEKTKGIFTLDELDKEKTTYDYDFFYEELNFERYILSSDESSEIHKKHMHD